MAEERLGNLRALASLKPKPLLRTWRRPGEAPQEMVDNQSLAPSSHARPSLKWTSQLHERFLEVVSRLGGASKATPRSVERLMGASGLTLYQLKIQLQKYRLAMKRGSESSSHGREEEGGGDGRFLEHQRARQTPMEFRRKSEERLEVQRHLQLRIEAQGKYLQSVLERAREMLEMDAADSQPSPAADADCLSSDGSCLTENDGASG